MSDVAKQVRRPGRRVLQVYRDNETQVTNVAKTMNVSCKEGCAHCCHLLTIVTMPEAIAIAEKLLSDPIQRMKLPALLQKLYKALEPLADAELTRESYFKKQAPCVFLSDDKKCAIYDVRPAACRYHFVVSPPENCAADAENQTVGRLDLVKFEEKVWEDGVRAMRQNGLAVSAGPLQVILLWALKLLSEGPTALDEAFRDEGILNLHYWNSRVLRLMGGVDAEPSPAPGDCPTSDHRTP